MSDTGIAIRVDKVYKDFKLPHLRKSTVKSVFTSLFDTSNRQKKYETQQALQDISFEIKKGEFFGIVGRNGSGKSTLLKILAGIYQPTKGTIQVGGKLVPFIELGVGFNPELTGRENVFLNGALIGFDKKTIAKMYDDIVEFAELEKFMDQKLKNYSSGMQVRLAFSMAIRADADILLIDEVLAVGDADFQRKCFDYFKQLKKNKKTVVFVSHDMNAVREYCDRAVMIEKSKVIASGSAEKIATSYTRMFVEQANTKTSGGEKNRWGDKKITYESVNATPAKVTDEVKELTIKMSIIAHEEVEQPIFGIMIKNSAGNSILGTNTKLKFLKIPLVKKGERISIEWHVPNLFSNGRHFIDPAIVYGDGTKISDWWEEAAEFDVHREEKSPYMITPDIEVKVTK